MKFVLVDIMLRTTVLLPCVPYSFITLARVKHYQAMTNIKHVSVYSYTEFFWIAKMDKIVEGFFLFCMAVVDSFAIVNIGFGV